jgi:hypothetical protein
MKKLSKEEKAFRKRSRARYAKLKADLISKLKGLTITEYSVEPDPAVIYEAPGDPVDSLFTGEYKITIHAHMKPGKNK